jgi:hypothetical protein
MNNRLINTKVAGGGGGCTDIVDNYDPFGGNGVALYQLNGDATDLSPNNYDGNAINTNGYVTGLFGQAIDNTTGYINLPASLCGATHTFSSWVYMDTIPGYVRYYNQYNGSAASWIGGFSNGYLNIDSTLASLQSVTNPIIAGQWNHIVYTRNNSDWNFYVNGSTAGSFIASNSLDTTLNTQIIGFDSNPNNNLIGKADQVRIFNTALTPLEVEALYTEELCICDGTVDTLDILGDGSCIATYQLDGNANDLSGNYSGEATDVSYGVGEFDLAGVFNREDANGSVIQITNDSFFRQKQTMSLSLWFKISNVDDNHWIFSDYNLRSYNIIARIQSTGELRVDNRYNDNTNFYTSTNTYDDGVWHHLAIINNVSNLTQSIYLDNSLLNVTAMSSSSWNTGVAGEVGIGSLYSTGNARWQDSFGGEIDQVRIFNKALSAGEVTTLYNETACTKAACSGTTNTLDILGDGSCIATYPLDGSPADLSGNYNGVQTDVTYPVGEFDLAGSFNGSSSRINIDATSTTPVDFSQENYSISLWLNPNSYTVNGTLFSKWDDTNSSLRAVLGYITDAGKIWVLEGVGTNNNSPIAPISASTISTGVWTHVVYTRTGTEGKIYINGSLDATASLSNTINTGGSTDFTLGIRGNGSTYGGNYLDGQLDQFRIFNKALSAEEVTTLYNETPCN